MSDHAYRERKSLQTEFHKLIRVLLAKRPKKLADRLDYATGQIYYWFNYCVLNTPEMNSRFDGLHGANMENEELRLVIQKLQELQQYEYCWDRIQNDVRFANLERRSSAHSTEAAAASTSSKFSSDSEPRIISVYPELFNNLFSTLFISANEPLDTPESQALHKQIQDWFAPLQPKPTWLNCRPDQLLNELFNKSRTDIEKQEFVTLFYGYLASQYRTQRKRKIANLSAAEQHSTSPSTSLAATSGRKSGLADKSFGHQKADKATREAITIAVQACFVNGVFDFEKFQNVVIRIYCKDPSSISYAYEQSRQQLLSIREQDLAAQSVATPSKEELGRMHKQEIEQAIQKNQAKMLAAVPLARDLQPNAAAAPIQSETKQGSRKGKQAKSSKTVLPTTDASIDRLLRDATQAVKTNNIVLLIGLLKQRNGKFPKNLNDTLIQTAYIYGKFEIAHFLVLQHASKSMASSIGAILSIAAYNGNVGMVKQLLDAGADVNHASPDGATPLLLAIANGHVAVVAQLLKFKKIKVNQAMANGATPLRMAAQYGNAEIVAQLIAAGSNVNQAMTDGEMPLYIAAQSGHAKVVAMLIAAGSNVNQAMTDGETPLLRAAQSGHAKVVAMLIAAGSNVNQAMTDGETPLIIAVQHGHAEIVAQLLDAGVDVNQTIIDGMTPLCLAAQSGHAKVVAMLIAAGSNVNQAMTDGETPLIIAAKHGNAEVVEQLRHADAAINQVMGNHGVTPLLLAIANGHVAVVGQLLKFKEIKVDQATRDGITPFIFALQNRYFLIANMLIRAGARPTPMVAELISFKDKNLLLNLHIAAGNIENVKAMLETGVDLTKETMTEFGRITAMNYASKIAALQVKPEEQQKYKYIVRLIFEKVCANQALQQVAPSSSTSITTQYKNSSAAASTSGSQATDTNSSSRPSSLR